MRFCSRDFSRRAFLPCDLRGFGFGCAPAAGKLRVLLTRLLGYSSSGNDGGGVGWPLQAWVLIGHCLTQSLSACDWVSSLFHRNILLLDDSAVKLRGSSSGNNNDRSRNSLGPEPGPVVGNVVGGDGGNMLIVDILMKTMEMYS